MVARQYAKCTAENFYQDSKAFDKFHMPYEQFIDNLIERQDKLSADNDNGEFEDSISRTWDPFDC